MDALLYRSNLCLLARRFHTSRALRLRPSNLAVDNTAHRASHFSLLPDCWLPSITVVQGVVKR
jgi:hypothetical protein